MFIVVAYDIKDDKRRGQVAKTMKDYGTRIQYSVFECNMNEKLLGNMQSKLSSIINIEDDKIRIYTLCNRCLKSVQILGNGETTQDEDVYIV